MDLINRDDAFAALGEMPENWTDSPEEIEAVNSWCYAVEAINSVPSVDAVPAKHGRWEDVGSLSCRCSECGCKNDRETRFCPNCGAKMDLEEQNENSQAR